MKPQIATTIEQSRRLLACGVDPKTADMCIITYPNGNQQAYVGQVTINAGTIYTDGELQAENIDLTGSPAWSLSALLGLLPEKYNEESTPDIPECKLCLQPHAQGWVIEYRSLDESYCLTAVYDTTLIGACVQMIGWLTAVEYKLNRAEG